MKTSDNRSQVASFLLNLLVTSRYIILLLILVVLGYYTAHLGIKVPVIVSGVLIIAATVLALFSNPKWGLYLAMFLSVLLPTLKRFVYSLPYGFVVEAILALVYIILFFRYFKKLDFSLAKNTPVFLLLIWLAYIILQIANPQAQSMAAWAYAMRGVALIQLLIIPLVFVLFTEKKDLKQFLIFYFSFSLIAILWGMKQQFFGLTKGELDYLYTSGAYARHILFGKLRVFSFYTDAGTFGAAMGQLCIISALLFLGPFSKKIKNASLVISILAFFALMVSGTRGALAIPAAGGLIYIIMIKNTKYIVLAFSILAFGFIFLKYTSIGSSNYNVNRLRTALDPEDASLHTRLENRKRLTAYLADKPFGGGVGSAGDWGQKFTPNTWLANFPPDGLYTRIRAETGIVGYVLYLGIWIYILILGFRICWNLNNPKYKSIATAFLASYAGILVANYGNEVMTQYPNNFVTFISLSFIFIIKRWDDSEKIMGS